MIRWGHVFYSLSSLEKERKNVSNAKATTITRLILLDILTENNTQFFTINYKTTPNSAPKITCDNVLVTNMLKVVSILFICLFLSFVDLHREKYQLFKFGGRRNLLSCGMNTIFFIKGSIFQNSYISLKKIITKKFIQSGNFDRIPFKW